VASWDITPKSADALADIVRAAKVDCGGDDCILTAGDDRSRLELSGRVPTMLTSHCGVVEVEPGQLSVLAPLTDLDLRAEVPVAACAFMRHVAATT
jgi:hypothetical protein